MTVPPSDEVDVLDGGTIESTVGIFLSGTGNVFEDTKLAATLAIETLRFDLLRVA